MWNNEQTKPRNEGDKIHAPKKHEENENKRKIRIKWCKLFHKYAPWRIAAFSGMSNCSKCASLCSKNRYWLWKKTPTKPPYCWKWYLRNASKDCFYWIQFTGAVERDYCAIEQKKKPKEQKKTQRREIERRRRENVNIHLGKSVPASCILPFYHKIVLLTFCRGCKKFPSTSTGTGNSSTSGSSSKCVRQSS